MNPPNISIRPMYRMLLHLVALWAIGSVAIAQSLFDNVSYNDGGRTHRFDLLHIGIDIGFDEGSRTVGGSVTHKIRSLDPMLREIRLDAADNMKFESISVDRTAARYTHRGDTLAITLPELKRYGQEFDVTIRYSVAPKKGFYFIQPDSLSPNKRRQIWTQGEANDNHYWIPIYDYPNDRSSTEVRIAVPESWKALSNGRLVEVSPVGADGRRTWHYLQEKPHSSYLIMVAAGDYLVTRDTVGTVPLEYWSYPEFPDRVETTFGRTPDIIRYIEGLTGIPYPWDKYAQIFIQDFMYGGMENTTATTLNDFALVDRRGFIDYNPDGLVAHEAAHMWYGDLVTNRSWGHLWVHESFATYIASRYRGHRYGADVFAKEVFDQGQAGLQADQFQGRNPVASGSGITANIYDRGSRILHMLRELTGEESFWRANKLFLERHAYGLVESNDLKIAFEDATGLNLDWFFEQWIYKAGMPSYRIDKSFEGNTLTLRVRQTQSRDSLTGLFQMPIPLEFHMRSGIVLDTIWVSKEDELFTFPMTERPRMVIFDAGDAVLKTVEYPRPEDELTAQLAAPRMIDRLLAVKALTDIDSMKVKSTVRRRSLALRDAFQRERTHFVRQEIVDRTSVMDPDIAAEIITRALRDSAADVRRAAAENSYLITDKSWRAQLLRPLLEDSSYSVIGATLSMLAVTDTFGLEPALRRMKGMKGRRDRLASTWLSAVSSGRYSSLVNDVAAYTLPEFTDETRVQAYFTLSKLERTTPEVRMAVERGLRSPVPTIRISAAAAARTHLDAEMRAALERLRPTLDGERKETVERILKK